LAKIGADEFQDANKKEIVWGYGKMIYSERIVEKFAHLVKLRQRKEQNEAMSDIRALKSATKREKHFRRIEMSSKVMGLTRKVQKVP
jgi:hypothetical protein